MPATFTRFLLSASPASGRPIPVAAIVTPGTLIHTAVAGPAYFDEVYLYATNVSALAVPLTIEFGGVLVGDQVAHSYTIPANSPPILLIDGLTINGGLLVRAFAGTTNVINISGYVNRIS